jgi:hypothetical protein
MSPIKAITFTMISQNILIANCKRLAPKTNNVTISPSKNDILNSSIIISSIAASAFKAQISAHY